MPSKVRSIRTEDPRHAERTEDSDDDDDVMSTATTNVVPRGGSHTTDSQDDHVEDDSDDNDDMRSKATTTLVARRTSQTDDGSGSEPGSASADEGDESKSSSPGKRKRGDESDEDEDDVDRLEDDDYDLLEENTGIRFKKKFRRVKMLDDDDSDDDATTLGTREQIAEELFDLDDDTETTAVENRTATAARAYSSEESSEDEIDDFIVDDSGAPVRRKRRKGVCIGDTDFNDERLQSAQDIFGVDFEVGDLEGNVDDDDSEDEEDTSRALAKIPKKPVTLAQIYEPAVLEHMHYTERDITIRQRDAPERFQRQEFDFQPPVEYMTKYIRDEASWIYDEMVKMKEIIVQKPAKVAYDESDSYNPDGTNGNEDWEVAASSVSGIPAGRLGVSISEAGFSTKQVDEDDEWESAPAPAVRRELPQETVDDWDDTASSVSGIPAEKLGVSKSEAGFSTKQVDVDGDWGSAPAVRCELPQEAGDDWDDAASSVGGVPAGTLCLSRSEAGFSTNQAAEGSAAGRGVKAIGAGEEDNWESGSVFRPTQIPVGPPVSELPAIATSSVVGHTAPAVVSPQESLDAKKEEVTKKIEEVLKHMKYELLEVPFIAKYRKDSYAGKLLEKHLWHIYHLDLKYTRLYKSKKSLQAIATATCTFMSDEKNEELLHSTLGRKYRRFTEEDVCFINNCNSFEEISDYRSFYSLHYGKLSPIMKSLRKNRQITAEKEQINWDKDLTSELNSSVSQIDEGSEHAISQLAPLPPTETLRVIRLSKYERLNLVLSDILDVTGITMSQMADNVLNAYGKHRKEPPAISPHAVAEPFVSPLCPTTSHVLDGLKFILSTQLAREPLVKKVLRNLMFDLYLRGYCSLTVVPTDKGRIGIDEFHILYRYKYVTNKRFDEFREDCFLKLLNGEQEKLIDIQFSSEFCETVKGDFLKEWIDYYTDDGCSLIIKEWNSFRTAVVEQAVYEILMPQFLQEVKSRLETNAKEFVLQKCREKIRNIISVGKFNLRDGRKDSEKDLPDEWQTQDRGARVMAIAYEADPGLAPFACVMKSDGNELLDYCTLGKLMLCHKSNEILCEEVSKTIKRFLLKNKPHFVVVGGESLDADNIVELVKSAVASLRENDESDYVFPDIPVETIPNSAAKVYSLSKLATSEYGEYPIVLRQAVSLARSILDPLVELGQLYNSDEDILCINFHPFQGSVDKEKLLEEIGEEFVTWVNTVGIDFNDCLKDPRMGHMLQFVCGLGPAKAAHLLRTFKRKTTSLLLNREQLHSIGKLENITFTNCAGFIRINVKELENGSDDVFLEYLDSTRVHPANYTQARFIAHDAIAEDEQYDESVVEVEYVQKILDDPKEYIDNVKALDVEEYNKYLMEQGYPRMTMVLEDIVKEFCSPFEDPRPPFTAYSPTESFYFLTKETPETIYVGKLMNAKVVGFSKGKCDTGESPENIVGTVCQTCQSHYRTPAELKNHMRNPKGVHVLLDNNLRGYMKANMLSDKQEVLVMERVKIGQAILCRIEEFNPEKRMVNVTSRSSDLRDDAEVIKPEKDESYDKIRELEDKKKTLKAAPVKTTGVVYHKKAIVHASFHNITYQDCVSRLQNMDNGDAIFRPSSKGADHLTLTWKLLDGIVQHVDIIEKKQQGGTKYFIDSEEYEDLDEILTRYVYPMHSFVRDISGHKTFVLTNPGYGREQVEIVLREKYSNNSRQLPYVFSALHERPGCFLLSYIIGGSLQTKYHYRHEVIKIVPEGFYYRHTTLEGLTRLLYYFKRHFRDPPPTETPMIGSATMTGSVQLF